MFFRVRKNKGKVKESKGESKGKERERKEKKGKSKGKERESKGKVKENLRRGDESQALPSLRVFVVPFRGLFWRLNIWQRRWPGLKTGPS